MYVTTDVFDDLRSGMSILAGSVVYFEMGHSNLRWKRCEPITGSARIQSLVSSGTTIGDAIVGDNGSCRIGHGVTELSLVKVCRMVDGFRSGG